MIEYAHFTIGCNFSTFILEINYLVSNYTSIIMAAKVITFCPFAADRYQRTYEENQLGPKSPMPDFMSAYNGSKLAFNFFVFVPRQTT